MMRLVSSRTLLSGFMLLFTLTAFAIPAQKRWLTVRQPDGTRLMVSMTGDEWLHYTATADGVPVVRQPDDSYCYASVRGDQLVSTGIVAHEASQRAASELEHIASGASTMQLRQHRAQRGRASSPALAKKSMAARRATYRGTHHVPVVLAYFPDRAFATDTASTRSFYNSMLNQPGFSQCGAPGSASDYFNDMSRGQFKLVFDVIGPVKVSKASTYYGGPSVYFGGTDHVGEFIAEAVTKADSLYKPDWSRYDWDGDGELEQVFVLYAGYGQATGGDTGLLWPCKWTLDEAKVNDDGPGGFSLGGTYINTFACGNELYGNSGKTYMGMGVFCHEFSHCLGLPDMYDTAYGATPTMGNWDLMAHGSYNGPQGIGWCPAGWTSYERAQAGWLDVKELQPGDSVRGMTSLDEGGEAYAIYNDDQRNEYYLLENHKHVGWDAYTPEQGLLIVHVDYDSTLFANNIVNTTGTFTTAEGYDGNFTNDHARMVPFSKLRSLENETYYYTFPMEGKRFRLDSLTDLSRPAATVYNAHPDGTLLMHKPVMNIAKDDEGNIDFDFMPAGGNPAGIVQPRTSAPEPARVTVYTVEGRQVGTYDSIDGLRALPRGLYIVEQGNAAVKKIVR